MPAASKLLLWVAMATAMLASASDTAPPTSMTTDPPSSMPPPPNPCYGLIENDCKINEDRCVWSDGCRPRQPPSPTVQRTRAPGSNGGDGGGGNGGNGEPPQCHGKGKSDCQQTPDCLPLPGVGCRDRPPKPHCPEAERNASIKCHIDARIALRRMLNFTFDNHNTDSPGVKLQLEQDLFCNLAPQLIFNVSAHCVRACYDDNDDLLGLPDAQEWCQDFNNGTALDAMFAKLNCSTQRSCDQLIAAGLASNAEVAPLMGSNAVIIRMSFAIAAMMAAAWAMMM